MSSSFSFSFLFPFPFPNLPLRPSLPTILSLSLASVAGTALVLTHSSRPNPLPPLPSPPWATLSLAPPPTSVDPKTGAEFPTHIHGAGRLLGVGVRRKNVLGLRNVDVYAFGVYADDAEVKKLSEKYGTLSVPELKENKKFYEEVLDEDICMTVRLKIVYGRLSIKSVRDAFEKSVGSRMQKFSQSDNKELLQRFTSLFKDEYKIPRGSEIDLSREQGYTLRIKIDGEEVGCLQSKLLCKSVMDLYIGEEPFDKQAKEEIELGLASLLKA